MKNAFVSFLRALDIGIEDVKAKTEKIDTEEFIKWMPDALKSLLLSQEETTGIQKLFQIICLPYS